MMIGVRVVFKPLSLVLMTILLALEACLRARVTNYAESIELVYTNRLGVLSWSTPCMELVYTSQNLGIGLVRVLQAHEVHEMLYEILI